MSASKLPSETELVATEVDSEVGPTGSKASGPVDA